MLDRYRHFDRIMALHTANARINAILDCAQPWMFRANLDSTGGVDSEFCPRETPKLRKFCAASFLQVRASSFVIDQAFDFVRS